MTPLVSRPNQITAALVTGKHEFDVPAFQRVFRAMPELDFYPQSLEDLVDDAGGVRYDYDVLVFYNMHGPAPDERTTEGLHRLGETTQGIFVLHHAILAFPAWPQWSDICGIEDRRIDRDDYNSYTGQTFGLEVTNPDHPITAGLSAWQMVDETYTMDDAGEGSEILLTTQHPQSMRTLAWTREFERARVFCYQSGHDAYAFDHPIFRTVVANGIRWLARRV